MAESAYLDADELRQLTGYSRSTEQRRFLTERGIPFKPDRARTIVMHRHVEAWIQGHPIARRAEPNFAMIQ